MKIFKHSIFVTALLALSFLSCDKAEDIVSMPDQTETVTYSVAIDQQTKALGEGNNVNYIWCGAYKEDNNNGSLTYTLSSESLTKVTGSSTHCKIEMVRDQSYKVVFVGQYFNDSNSGPKPAYHIDKVQAKIYMPIKAVTNTDHYDLFTYVDPVTDFQPRAAKDITLSRRVAQINFVAEQSDLDEAKANGSFPETSKVVLSSVPEYISLLDGTVSATSVQVEYAEAPLANPGENPLATVFCLAKDSACDVEASLYLYKGSNELKRYTSITVPFKLNYKTNVTVSL